MSQSPRGFPNADVPNLVLASYDGPLGVEEYMWNQFDVLELRQEFKDEAFALNCPMPPNLVRIALFIPDSERYGFASYIELEVVEENVAYRRGAYFRLTPEKAFTAYRKLPKEEGKLLLKAQMP